MQPSFKKNVNMIYESTVSVDSAESIEVNMVWLLPCHGCYWEAHSVHGVKVKELPADQMIVKTQNMSKQYKTLAS